MLRLDDGPVEDHDSALTFQAHGNLHNKNNFKNPTSNMENEVEKEETDRERRRHFTVPPGRVKMCCTQVWLLAGWPGDVAVLIDSQTVVLKGQSLVYNLSNSL